MRLLLISALLFLFVAACGGDNNSTSTTSSTNGAGSGETSITPSPTAKPFPTSTGEAGATATTAVEELQLRDPPAGFTVPTLAGAESECTPDRKSRVALTWQPSQPEGQEQQVQLSAISSFAAGAYQTSQVLQPQVSTLYWEGLTPGSTYYWRVATRVDGGWVVVDPQRFSTEPCPPLDQR